jgi:hypothetical protein
MDDELYVVWNTLNDAVPFTTKSPLIIALPVTPSEPVICAEPVNGNGETYPVKYDAVKANEDEITLFEPCGPNTPDAVMNDAVCASVTYDAVVAKSAREALTAYDADVAFCAKDAVVE